MHDLHLIPFDDLTELWEWSEPPRIDSLAPRARTVERVMVTTENTVVIASMIVAFIALRRALPLRHRRSVGA